MSVPSMEELARTICLAVWNHDYTPRDPKHPDERWAQALAAARAVLDQLKPVVAKACGQAMACAFPEDYQGDKTDEQLLAASQRDHDVATNIATRIIERIKSA